MNKVLLAVLSILIAVVLFYLIKYLLNRLIDKKISNYQNDLVTKHYNEVENIYRQMRGWRHDFHNHIQVMKAYLKLGKYEDMEKYLTELDKDLTNIDTVLRTGNLMVDAILNSKLSMARSQDIKINAKATVPKDIRVSDLDYA